MIGTWDENNKAFGLIAFFNINNSIRVFFAHAGDDARNGVVGYDADLVLA